MGSHDWRGSVSGDVCGGVCVTDISNSPRILSSWKEIAAYLGKGVRTVQRWERELSLPVRRPNNGKHVVIAFGYDLDRWITELQAHSEGTPCCDCRVKLEIAEARIS